jgi:hypothetical protein
LFSNIFFEFSGVNNFWTQVFLIRSVAWDVEISKLKEDVDALM